MFLNTKNEIVSWVYDNIYCDALFDYANHANLSGIVYNNLNEQEIREEIAFNIMFYFSEENKQLVLNTYENFIFEINSNILELPIKLGTINGDFNIIFSKIESFKGFPKIIKGDLEFPGNNIKDDKYWEVEEIDGNINLCSLTCELDNLKFLENTKFEKIYLKVSNTPFKNDNISEIEIKHSIVEDDFNLLYYKDFKNYLKDLNLMNENLDNYLDSFESNNISKEL